MVVCFTHRRLSTYNITLGVDDFLGVCQYEQLEGVDGENLFEERTKQQTIRCHTECLVSRQKATRYEISF